MKKYGRGMAKVMNQRSSGGADNVFAQSTNSSSGSPYQWVSQQRAQHADR
jgi:hypothetical protein